MANINKKYFVDEIARETGFVKGDVKRVIEEFIGLVGDSLVAGNTIELRGFGTFACKPRKARPARNPRTGDTVRLEARMVPTFKFSDEIRDRIERADTQPAAVHEVTR